MDYASVRSLPAMFFEVARKRVDRPFLWAKHDGRYRKLSWGEAIDQVDRFGQSLAALAPFGRLVVYGISTREQVQVSTGSLLRSSRAVVGFWLMHCLERPKMLREPLRDLFERAARGELRAVVGGTYGLSEVRRAHEDLAGRRTSGKLLLDPSS